MSASDGFFVIDRLPRTSRFNRTTWTAEATR